MISNERLEEIRELCDEATAGPWLALEYWDLYAVTSAYGVAIIPVAESVNRARGCSQEDANFIAEARDIIPELLEAIDDLKAELQFAQSGEGQ